jgi:polyvinyl alcohol dehydrogenase (cytochrome)
LKITVQLMSGHDRTMPTFSASQFRALAPPLAALALAAAALQSNAAGPAPAQSPDGAALYQARCAACHDSPAERTPSRIMLSTYRTPEEIIAALANGVMRQQAAGLSADEVRALAVHLTGKQPIVTKIDPMANACTRHGALHPAAGDWNGWGRDLANTRLQPHGGLAASDVPRLELKWAFAFPGRSAFGQPVVVGDRLYAGGIGGRVYSLDARTGCTHWSFDAGAPVRTATVVAALPRGAATHYAAFFGDDKGYVHAVDAERGTSLWSTQIDPHPVARILGTPQFFAGRLYVPVSSGEEVAAANESYPCCTFRGSIAALEAATGRVLWQSYVVRESPEPTRRSTAGVQLYGPAGGAIFSAPTIDEKRGLIYVATGDSYTSVHSDSTNAVIAFDLASGERRWTTQVLRNDAWILGCANGLKANCPEPLGRDFDFASSPVLTTAAQGRAMLVAGAKSGIVYGLDPDADGRLVWQVKLAPGSPDGGILWGPAADGVRAYVATSDYSWPTGRGPGGLAALDIATGHVLWSAAAPVLPCSWGPERCSQGHLAAVSVIPGAVFSGGLDGRMRAYAPDDGKVLWTFDTAGPFKAVNGGEARGGAIDYGGQVVANGMLYVYSGSMRQAGNALLAFGPASPRSAVGPF